MKRPIETFHGTPYPLSDEWDREDDREDDRARDLIEEPREDDRQ